MAVNGAATTLQMHWTWLQLQAINPEGPSSCLHEDKDLVLSVGFAFSLPSTSREA